MMSRDNHKKEMRELHDKCNTHEQNIALHVRTIGLLQERCTGLESEHGKAVAAYNALYTRYEELQKECDALRARIPDGDLYPEEREKVDAYPPSPPGMPSPPVTRAELDALRVQLISLGQETAKDFRSVRSAAAAHRAELLSVGQATADGLARVRGTVDAHNARLNALESERVGASKR